MTNKLLSLIFLQIPHLITIRNAQNCAVFGNAVLAKYAGKKYLRQVKGLSDYDAPWGNNAHHYARHDQDAFNGICYQQFEPCYTKEGYKVLLMHKIALRKMVDGEHLLMGIAVEITDKVILTALRIVESQSPLASGSIVIVSNQSYLENRFPDYRFTEKEIECIYYILRGRTAKVIAGQYHCSPKTIEARIEQLRWKLDCASKQMLIDKLYEMGFMSMIPQSILYNRLGYMGDSVLSLVINQ